MRMTNIFKRSGWSYQKKYDMKQTKLNFVTDYVVLSIAKQEEGFWEKSSWTAKEWKETFDNLLSEYDSSISDISTTKENVVTQLDESTNKLTEEISDKKGDDSVNDSNPENLTEKETPEVKEAKIAERKQLNINFINYNRNTFVFELD